MGVEVPSLDIAALATEGICPGAARLTGTFLLRKDGGCPPASRSFHLSSVGCSFNQVESEVMISALERAGWAFVSETAASVLICNTCCVMAEARTRSLQRIIGLKERYPEKMLFVVGCLPERYREALCRELPEVDGFLGNKEPSAVVQLVEDQIDQARQPCNDRQIFLSSPGSAIVKVAEGCSRHCSYCAIPLVRGELRSRPREEILSEIKGLWGRGAREFVLIAQDLGMYGRDLGTDLLALLSDISSLDGDFRVRLRCIHPDHFPDELLDLVAADSRFYRFFDLSFQHAAPGILRAMRRRGDPQRNLGLISKIRSRLPDAAVQSEFIVGFPGESDADFECLLDFQARARLDWATVYAYSREEGTAAYSMPGQVGEEVARARKAEMDKRQFCISQGVLDGRVRTTLDVFVRGELGKREACYGKAFTRGFVGIRQWVQPGTIVQAHISRRVGLVLEGELAPGPG